MKKLFELRKSYWRSEASGDGGEMLVSPNKNHAMAKFGERYWAWDFDLLPGETLAEFKKRDREASFKEWLNKIKSEALSDKG